MINPNQLPSRLILAALDDVLDEETRDDVIARARVLYVNREIVRISIKMAEINGRPQGDPMEMAKRARAIARCRERLLKLNEEGV